MASRHPTSVANKPTELKNIRDVRKKLGLNQIAFWEPIGVTQSGGSRYESGRKMPKSIQKLVSLIHIEKIDLNKVNKLDLIIVDHLKQEYPDIYEDLKSKSDV